MKKPKPMPTPTTGEKVVAVVAALVLGFIVIYSWWAIRGGTDPLDGKHKRVYEFMHAEYQGDQYVIVTDPLDKSKFAVVPRTTRKPDPVVKP